MQNLHACFHDAQAAETKNCEAVTALMINGADPLFPDSSGNTALHLYLEKVQPHKQEDMVHFLAKVSHAHSETIHVLGLRNTNFYSGVDVFCPLGASF